MTSVMVVIGIIAGALVSVSVIWNQGVKPFIAFCKKMDEANNIILEFPEWTAKLDSVHHELNPNGGESMKDRVDQTHRMLSEHIMNQDIHKDPTNTTV